MVTCECSGSRVLDHRPSTGGLFVEGYQPAEHLLAGDFPNVPPALKTRVSDWGPHASSPAWFGTWTNKTMASLSMPFFQEQMVKIILRVGSICKKPSKS